MTYQGKDFEELGTRTHRRGEGGFPWEGNLSLSVKIMIMCSSWPSTPRNLFYIAHHTYTMKFIAMLFATAKDWTPSKYPATGDWLNTAWYIRTMKDYESVNNNFVAVYVIIEKDLDGNETGRRYESHCPLKAYSVCVKTFLSESGWTQDFDLSCGTCYLLLKPPGHSYSQAILVLVFFMPFTKLEATALGGWILASNNTCETNIYWAFIISQGLGLSLWRSHGPGPYVVHGLLGSEQKVPHCQGTGYGLLRRRDGLCPRPQLWERQGRGQELSPVCVASAYSLETLVQRQKRRNFPRKGSKPPNMSLTED